MAIDAAGSQKALASIIGRSQQVVCYWAKRGKPLPAEYVTPVSIALSIPKHVLRPDIFGPYEHMQAPICVENAAGAE